MTSLILAPNTFLNISAKMSGSAPAPRPPIVNGFVSMSFQVLIGEVFQVMHTLTSVEMLPSQVNLEASNGASSSSGATAMLRENVPMTVPSFGAAL